ncbi:MAG: alpha/beta fold hydrolase [Patescibacteria group bacterium]
MIKKEKITIKNRKGLKIVILVEKPKNPKGLAFVLHGLGGFKEQAHIKTFASAFLELGYTVVRYDSTNSIGESGGKMENATLTNYYRDFLDVLKWAKKKSWYCEPFCLSGHSFGGGVILNFTEKYPKQVKALAPISTFISSKLSFKKYTKKDLLEWKRRGYRLEPSKSKPGLMKKYSWNLMVDINKYDLLEKANKLIMPVLLIIGDKDAGIRVEYIRKLFNKLPRRKEFYIIKNAPHTFKEKEHLSEIKKIMKKWIKKIE